MIPFDECFRAIINRTWKEMCFFSFHIAKKGVKDKERCYECFIYEFIYL